ncbi:MAG: hypothetical protein O7G84_05085 [Gammaproteobacteria bacterium]|nr:hypothetical protein [Gammaproteobacteria bacterium]
MKAVISTRRLTGVCGQWTMALFIALWGDQRPSNTIGLDNGVSVGDRPAVAQNKGLHSLAKTSWRLFSV